MHASHMDIGLSQNLIGTVVHLHGPHLKGQWCIYMGSSQGTVVHLHGLISRDSGASTWASSQGTVVHLHGPPGTVLYYWCLDSGALICMGLR